MKILKIIVYYLVALLLTVLFALLFYKGYKSQSIDIDMLQKHSGHVVATGVTVKESGRDGAAVFYLKLEGLEQTLGIYRGTHEYQDLTSNIKKNDYLTVYYLKSTSSDINTDLVQIEKDDQVILAKSEYEATQSYLLWIGAVGVLVVVFFSINFYYNNFESDL